MIASRVGLRVDAKLVEFRPGLAFRLTEIQLDQTIFHARLYRLRAECIENVGKRLPGPLQRADVNAKMIETGELRA
jgi:hypothetical protein